MNRYVIVFIFLSATFVLFNSCRNSVDPVSINHEIIVLQNGLLIDGTGALPIENAVVAVEDKHIIYAGPGSGYQIPNNVRIIDIAGSVILPGFMNTHVHNGYVESNLKEWAKSGVTTVRDLGYFDDPFGGFPIRDLLLIDNFNARLVAAGPMVTTIGGYGSYEVASPEDARLKVIGLIDAGADIIKIAIEDDLQGRRWPMLSQEEINTIVNTAHERNIPVSAHISTSKHLAIAVQAGVDDVAHMIVDGLPDSLITAMIEKDIYWVPTLELWDGVSKMHQLNWGQQAINNLDRFVKAGGKVALGTDYDGYITEFDLGMPVSEIKLMKEANMTVMQIITAGTKNAAYVCNLEDELGTIEKSKIADLLILRNNPLENINAFTDVRMVFHNGIIIREDY